LRGGSAVFEILREDGTMETTVAEQTRQSVSFASKEGKRFLRKCLREEFGHDGWIVTIRPGITPADAPDVEFYREIPGELGTPNAEVRVYLSDAPIRGFDHRCVLTYEANAMVRLMLDGWRIYLGRANSSPASVVHDVRTRSIRAEFGYTSVAISTSVFVGTRAVMRGSVDEIGEIRDI